MNTDNVSNQCMSAHDIYTQMEIYRKTVEKLAPSASTLDEITFFNTQIKEFSSELFKIANTIEQELKIKSLQKAKREIIKILDINGIQISKDACLYTADGDELSIM